MANPLLRKSYIAGGTIAPGLAVKFSGAGTVVVAAAGTDALIGITVPQLTPGTGDRVDVVHAGIADAVAGGAVTRGDEVTSDASGKMVSTAPTSGATGRIVGIALDSAVSGDIFPVLVQLGQRTTP